METTSFEYKPLFDRADILPDTAVQLVDWLNKNFPLTSPRMDETERFIFFKAGQRHMIDMLLQMKERTTSPPLQAPKPDPKDFYTSDNFPE